MDEFEQEHNSRYKKMFELLRQGDLRPDAGTQNRSAAMQQTGLSRGVCRH
ncbi:hypothetical protein [Sulfitobacter geojensis]